MQGCLMVELSNCKIPSCAHWHYGKPHKKYTNKDNPAVDQYSKGPRNLIHMYQVVSSLFIHCLTVLGKTWKQKCTTVSILWTQYENVYII